MSAEEAYTDAIEATEGLHGVERERVIAEHMEGYGYRVPRQSAKLKATLTRATARTRAKYASKPHPTYAGSFERLHGAVAARAPRTGDAAEAQRMTALLRENRQAHRAARRSATEADYAALFGGEVDVTSRFGDNSQEKVAMSGCKRNANGTFAKGNKCGKSKAKRKGSGKRRAKGHRRHIGPYLPNGGGFYSTSSKRGKGKSKRSRKGSAKSRGPSDRKLKKLANRYNAATKRASQGKGLPATAARKLQRLKRAADRAASARGRSTAPKLRIGRVRKAGKGHRRHVGPMTAGGSFFS